MTWSSSEEDTATCELESPRELDGMRRASSSPATVVGIVHAVDCVPRRREDCEAGGKLLIVLRLETPNPCLSTPPPKAERWAGWIGGGDSARLLEQLPKKTKRERRKGVSD